MNRNREISKKLKSNPELVKELQAELESMDLSKIPEEDEIPSFETFISERPTVSCITYKKKSRAWKKPRTLIPIAASIILMLFFVATPTGRGFALGIYETVVSMFDGGTTIHHGGGDDEPVAIAEVQNGLYSDVHEVQKEYDVSVAFLENYEPVDKIEVSENDGILEIITNYDISGEEFTIIQVVYHTHFEATAQITGNDEQRVEVVSACGLEFYGDYYDMAGFAQAYEGRSSITVSVGGVSKEVFIELLENINYGRQ